MVCTQQEKLAKTNQIADFRGFHGFRVLDLTFIFYLYVTDLFAVYLYAQIWTILPLPSTIP